MRSILTVLGLAILITFQTACDSSGGSSDVLTGIEATFDCEVREIAVSGTATGALEDSDCDYRASDGTVTDYYAVTLDAPTRVVITQRSDVIDSFLTLYDDLAEPLFTDDDSAGRLDAELVLDLQPGTYVISAGVLGA